MRFQFSENLSIEWLVPRGDVHSGPYIGEQVLAYGDEANNIAVWREDKTGFSRKVLESGDRSLYPLRLAANPQSSVVAAATRNEILLWTREQSPPMRLRNDAWVEKLWFSGNYLMASSDNEIRVWEIVSKKYSVLEHESVIIGLTTWRGSEGTAVATLSRKGVIRIWGLIEGGEDGAVLPVHSWPAMTWKGCLRANEEEPLLFDPVNHSVWQRCDEAGLEHARTWSPQEGKLSGLLPFHGLSAADDGSVAFNLADATSWIWTAGSDEPRRLGGYKGGLQQVWLSQNGDRVMGVISSGRGTVEVLTWKADAPEQASPTGIRGSYVHSWSLSVDGKWLAICINASQSTTLLHHLDTARTIKLDAACRSVHLTPDGQWLLVIEQSDSESADSLRRVPVMKAWKTADVMSQTSPGKPPSLVAHTIAFSADGLWAASVTENAEIRLFTPSVPDSFQVLEQEGCKRGNLPPHPIKGLILSRDGRWIAAVRWNGKGRGYDILLWSREKPETCRKFLTAGRVQPESFRLDFTGDGRYLLIGGDFPVLVDLDQLEQKPIRLDGAYVALAPDRNGNGDDEVVLRSDPSTITLYSVQTRRSRTLRLPFALTDPARSVTSEEELLISEGLAASWTVKGGWLLGEASGDGSTQAFPLDGSHDAMLRSLLKLGTSTCLLPEHRIGYLGESKQGAEQAYEQCRQKKRQVRQPSNASP